MNYQTEKVDFGNTPTTSPTPTPTPTPEPTPTPKKDEAVVSSVTFTKVEKKSNEATVSLVFSKLELADTSKKIFVLEVTKKGETTPIQVSDLSYDETTKTLSGKLSKLKEGTYNLSKLTLNGNEINLNDTVKNSKLLIEDQNNNGNGGNEQGDKPSNTPALTKEQLEAKVADLDKKVKEATTALTEAENAVKTEKAGKNDAAKVKELEKVVQEKQTQKQNLEQELAKAKEELKKLK